MSQLAVIGSKDLFNAKDLETLKNSKFKGFESHEIEYCAKVCNQLALSPFLNQIHFVKRKNKDGSSSIAAQVGIDGFRLAAQRTNAYAGSDEIVFEYDGSNKKKPVKATATVYKLIGGQRCPFTASARWDEFFNPSGGMWDRLPHQMLGKCAEAQALRKAFPAELSNIYAPEEMAQADRGNKADTVNNIVSGKSDVIETEGRDVTDEPQPDGEQMSCAPCGSNNVMKSLYHENTIYCKDCKKTSQMRPA